MPARSRDTSQAEPEILPPRAGGKAGSLFNDEHLDLLSRALDTWFRVPGTNIRFGLDGIVGLVPGIGDVLGGLASSVIVLAAWFRGVEKITILRMVANLAIEVGIGLVPWVGDAFDIAWRANRRNYALLERSIAEPHRHAGKDALFLIGLCLILLVLIWLPLLVLTYVTAALLRHLGMHLPGH
jgi:hypothetical protein